MRTLLPLLLALVAAPLARAQSGSFSFSTGSAVGGAAVTETVAGVTLGITATGTGSGTLGIAPWDGWGGTTGPAAYNNGIVSGVTLTFSAPVNLASLKFVGYDPGGTFVFTPSTGSAVTASDAGTGIALAPPGGFVGITSLSITEQSGGSFFFVIDDIAMDASLPVELVDFGAVLDGNAVVLHWATASETNNSGFEVEVRGPDATGFRRIAFLPGHGTTLEANRYAYRIEGLTSGRHAFRLRQMDTDGAASLSGVVEVVVGRARELSLETRGGAVIVGSRGAGPVTVEAFDVLGRRVAVLFEGEMAAGSSHPVRLHGVAAGMYFVRASNGRVAETTRLVVR